MPPEPEKDPLQALNERIYRANANAEARVQGYVPQEQPKAYGWTPPPAPPPAPPKRGMPWTVKFLIAAGAFFLLAGGVAAFFLLHGTRAISSDRVQVQVAGPTTIASGDTVTLVFTVHNGNPAAMNSTMLFAQMPDGTRRADDDTQSYDQYTDTLGTVNAGADATRSVQVKLFGAQNQALSIPVRVEYRTEGSNALFVSNATYTVTVSTSPVSVQVSTLTQSASGQPLTLDVAVRSNATSPLTNVALMAQPYPSGFVFTSATPAPVSGSYFLVGDLAPGEEKHVKLVGTLTGQEGDQRVFRFTVGTANPDGTNTLGVPYAEGDAVVTLTHPFLNVALSVGQSNVDPVIASPGQLLNAMLTWQNTLSGPLTNARIQVKVSGNALATGSIQGGSGFYSSTDSTVLFSAQTNPSLASLQSGDSGVGSFSFAVKPAAQLAGVPNPTITLSISVAGTQSGGGSAQTLTSTLTRTIKVGSEVSLTGALSHTGGMITNTGPVPPVAGTKTTYTVKWTAKNALNSVGGAKVSATLPDYVTFTGVLDPANSAITYNDATRTVTWNVGDLGSGATSAAGFQVSVLPSASQNGTSPIVVNAATFTGTDRFTSQQVSAQADPLTISL